MSKAVLAWLGVLFVVAGGSLLWLGFKQFVRPDFSVQSSIPMIDRDYQRKPLSASEPYLTEFTLTERSGKKRGTAELAGRVFVTNFFFTYCPTECRQQQAAFDRVQRDYGPKGVQFLSITCDPDNDHPDRLREYALRLNADHKHWSFLTGQMLYSQRIASEMYQVHLEKLSHSERFFVTDKWGHVRGNFEWNNLAEMTDMRVMLDRLLAETEEPAELKKPAAPATVESTAPAAESAPPAAEPAAKSEEN